MNREKDYEEKGKKLIDDFVNISFGDIKKEKPLTKEQDKLKDFIEKHLDSIEGRVREESYPTWKGEEDDCQERMAIDILKFIK